MDELVFIDPDAWDRFDAARTKLLDECADWLRRQRSLPGPVVEELVGFAHLVTDWKFSYGDGHLARWRRSEVEELLLDWSPRKLSIAPGDCAEIPEALACYVEFLDHTGRLERGSASVSVLASTARGLTEEFVEAMSEPAAFGPAKALVVAAVAEGVDISDPSSIQAWMEEFNNRPLEERSELISAGDPLALDRSLSVPPVAMPADDEVQRSKEEAPVLRAFAALANHVGSGRKLTAAGNLTLADARALVPLLGTGDVLDPEVAGEPYRIRSAGELTGLSQMMVWAYKAGVVRKANGKVIVTKRGLAIGRAPAAHFDRVIDALFEIGPLRSQRSSDGWLAWPAVDEVLDGLVPLLLAGPYVAAGPVPIEALIETAVEAVNDELEFRFAPEIVERRVTADVIDSIDTLVLAGLVTRSGIDDGPDGPHRSPRRQAGGTVALTPAGVVITHGVLVEMGFDAPVAGAMAGLNAAELLLALEPDDYPTMRAEVSAWLARRSAQESIDDLARAVATLDDPGLRSVALAIMAEVDVDLAEPAVRRLVDRPDCKGFALCWLVDHEREPSEVLFDPGDLSTFVDVLAVRLVVGGEDGLRDTLALAGGFDAQLRTIAGLWRASSGATEIVLAAIGELHPAKKVAKAARKAVLQRRSWLAGGAGPSA